MPSSLIKALAYSADSRVLSVWFQTTPDRYDYRGVPAETYQSFRSAYSKGQFFNKAIRGRFAYDVAGRGVGSPR
jgi:hypothetical protein